MLVAFGLVWPAIIVHATLPAEARQIALIEARIYSHAGDAARALAIYRQLRRDFPADRDIQLAFVGFLLDQGRYDAAQSELTAWLETTPGDRQAQRLQARLFHEQGRYGQALAIYDGLVAAAPDDPILWADEGAARLGNAQWSEALDAYSRVLEITPENQDVRAVVHGIIREHGPRLDIGQYRYRQLADDSVIDTVTASLGQPLSGTTRLLMDYRHIAVSRPRQPFIGPVKDTFDDLLINLRRQINPRWSASVGIGGYNGASTGTSVVAGASYLPAEGIRLTAEYQTHRPWYDPLEAVDCGGEYDRLQLALGWRAGGRTTVSLQAEDWRYRLDQTGDYGAQQTIQGQVSLRLLSVPELTVGYGYYRAWFDYANDQDRSVAMIADQGWHTLYGSFSHHPGACWFWGLSGGLRRDHVRNIDGWFFNPTVTVHLGKRIVMDGGYQYASESATAVGGQTQTWQIAGRFYF